MQVEKNVGKMETCGQTMNRDGTMNDCLTKSGRGGARGDADDGDGRNESDLSHESAQVG